MRINTILQHLIHNYFFVFEKSANTFALILIIYIIFKLSKQMKKILFLLMLAFVDSKAEAQSQTSEPFSEGGKTYNCTASWTEDDYVTYIINDRTPLEELSPIELVMMAPRKESRKYAYVWGNDGLDHYDMTSLNYLQEGEFFSLPLTMFRFKRNGEKEEYSLDGNFINSEQDISINSSQFENIHIENVSPIFSIDSSFSFVPKLTHNDVYELQQQGYQVINNYPLYIEISNSEVRIIYDERNKTISTIYKERDGEITDMITDYFSQSETQLIKIKTIDQYYRTMPNGRCVVRNKVRLYKDLLFNGANGLELRQSNQNKDVSVTHIFPNPTSGEFYIQCSDGIPSNIKIYDLSGRSV